MLHPLQPLYHAKEMLLLLQRLGATGARGSSSTARRKLSDSDTFHGATLDHSVWDAILQAHVHQKQLIQNGVSAATVDYDGIASDERFSAYLHSLATVDLATLAPAESLALLINAYNALCINLIIQHERAHPGMKLRSITQLSGRTQVWDQPAGTLGGQTVSLSHVEHKLLRGQWDEPSLHFCIVCASASCPDLRAGAYTAPTLVAQMREQADAFFRDRTKGLAWDGATLSLSRILYWFADDWGGAQRAADAALVALGDDGVARAARNTRLSRVLQLENSWRTRYFPYCWAMNRV